MQDVNGTLVATDSKDVLDNLTKIVGRMVKDTSGRSVTLVSGGAIVRPSGDFTSIELGASVGQRFSTLESNEDNAPIRIITNAVTPIIVTYNRGNAYTDAVKLNNLLKQSGFLFNYFRDDAPFAYKSGSTVSPQYVQINQQELEERAVMILDFHTLFIETYTPMEIVEKVGVSVKLRDGKKTTIKHGIVDNTKHA